MRIIGIDTPERGQCGWHEATVHLQGLIAGRPVVATPGARDDVDRYGRLLRYIEVDGTDAGLAQIADGFAIARYDSRDGYGHHPRQEAYIAAQATAHGQLAACAAAGSATPASKAPTTTVAGSAQNATDPRFPTCKAAKAAGHGPYTSDQVEYGWYRDADHDGIVCE